MFALLAPLLFLAQAKSAPALESHAQALSDDGELFAYAVTDGTLRIVALPQGEPQIVTTGLPQVVMDLAWSPSKASLACVTSVGSVRVLARADGKLLCETPAGAAVLPTWSRPTVDFVDGGTRILITGAQARARLVDVSTGALVSEFLAGPESKLSSESSLGAVAISRDRKHFAIGDAAGLVSVRSTHTGDIEYGPFRLPTVFALDFDSNGTQLAVGVAEGGVRVLALDGPSDPIRLWSQDDELWGSGGLRIGSVRFSEDGTRVLATSFERAVIRLWDVRSRSVVWENETTDIPDADSATTSSAGSPPVFVIAHSGVVLDAVKGTNIGTLSSSFGPGQYRVSGSVAWVSAGGSIKIVEPRQRRIVRELYLSPLPPLKSCAQALSADERLFAYSVSDGTVHIASLPDGKPVVVASGFAKEIGGLAFSPDGKELASVAPDGRIRIVACKDGGLLTECQGPPATWPSWWTSCAIAFVDGGTKLLIGGRYAEVDLIRRSDGEALSRIRFSDSLVTASAVSADGQHFAIGDNLGRCTVYSANSGGLEFGPIETSGHVNAVALDAHGQRLAVGSGDDRARVFTLAKGATPVLLSHASENLTGELEIGYVAFSPDGEQLLSTSLLGWDMRVWDARTGAMQWSTTQGFEGCEYPVVAHFVALPEPRVITCNGFLFDARSGRGLPSIGKEREWGHLTISGSYAWRHGPRGIEVSDVRTGKRVCTLPLAEK